jgi:hypothetical protein
VRGWLSVVGSWLLDVEWFIFRDMKWITLAHLFLSSYHQDILYMHLVLAEAHQGFF